MPSAKTTSTAADATVPWNKSTPTIGSDEPAAAKFTGSADDLGTEANMDENAGAAKVANPPSLVDLATQCVSAGAEKRRAWADMPVEPTAMQSSSGPCYDLDPTPQEAAAAAAAAAVQKPTSSDSGGEDSAKENKETPSDRSDNGKGTKKKGL